MDHPNAESIACATPPTAAVRRERDRIAAWLRDCALVARCWEQVDARRWNESRATLYDDIARSILAGEHLPGNPEGPF
jgi:hypothetical protein